MSEHVSSSVCRSASRLVAPPTAHYVITQKTKQTTLSRRTSLNLPGSRSRTPSGAIARIIKRFITIDLRQNCLNYS